MFRPVHIHMYFVCIYVQRYVLYVSIAQWCTCLLRIIRTYTYYTEPVQYVQITRTNILTYIRTQNTYNYTNQKVNTCIYVYAKLLMQLPHSAQVVHCLKTGCCWYVDTKSKKWYVQDFKKLPNQNSIHIKM